MPVNTYSRYRNLNALSISHGTRGRTRSLPIRRLPVVPSVTGTRSHRFTGYESADLLALRYLSREDLYWYLLDINGKRLPDQLEPGEMLQIPPLAPATRVDRTRR